MGIIENWGWKREEEMWGARRVRDEESWLAEEKSSCRRR